MRCQFSETSPIKYLGVIILLAGLNGCSISQRQPSKPDYLASQEGRGKYRSYGSNKNPQQLSPPYRPQYEPRYTPNASSGIQPLKKQTYAWDQRPTTGSLQTALRHHVVKPRETLYRISRIYDVNMERIQQANRIDDPFWLETGRTLIIPDS